MTPTNELLEAFCRALAESSGPPPIGPPTHFLCDPEPLNGGFGDTVFLTLTAKDDNEQTVTTYVGPPDTIIPSGVCNGPTDDGWADGVGTYECTSSSAGDGTITFIDTVVGVIGTSNQHWS